MAYCYARTGTGPKKGAAVGKRMQVSPESRVELHGTLPTEIPRTGGAAWSTTGCRDQDVGFDGAGACQADLHPKKRALGRISATW